MRSGRNAKRKAARLIEQQAAYFSASGSQKHKEDYLRSPEKVKADIKHEIGRLRLANWQRELDEAAVRLGSPGAWQVYRTNRNEAAAWGVEQEFLLMTQAAAARFLGRSRSTLLSHGQ